MKVAGIALMSIGVALLAVGVMLGVLGVHRDGVNCGSGFRGVSQAASVADLTAAIGADNGFNPDFNPARSVADDCKSATSDRSTVAWAVLIPGGVLAFVGLALKVREPA